MNKEYLISMMKNCRQFENQSVYDHCVSVQDIFKEMWDETTKYPVPEWFVAEFNFIKSRLIPYEDILEYTLFHDVGKPFCINYENNIRHFPNHAEISYQIYSKVSNNKDVLYCIRNDMKIHTIKDAEISKFIDKYSATFVFVGFCELFANAKYFGGYGSESYKIKFKQLNRRGKKIINILKDKT